MYYILHSYEGTTKTYKLHHTYNRNYGGRSALRLPIDGCAVVVHFWQLFLFIFFKIFFSFVAAYKDLHRG